MCAAGSNGSAIGSERASSFSTKLVGSTHSFVTPTSFHHSPAKKVVAVGGTIPETTASNAAQAPRVSMIIPTRNEAGNIRPLLARLSALPSDVLEEVIFVDDSDDDTPGAIVAFGRACAFPVILIHRRVGHRLEGLAGAVLEGFKAASGQWLCVMDGDLQHPPEVIEELRGAVLQGDVDLVCASRYAEGGDGHALGRLRRLVSKGSTWAARGAFPWRLRSVTDPMSGFFMVRRDALDLSRFRPTGFKILLEILVRVRDLRRREVTYQFATRHAEDSKASWREGLRYLEHLGRLRLGLPERSRHLPAAVRFSLVGASGVAVNNLLLWALVSGSGLGYLAASVLATQASIGSNFLLTERWVFPGTRRLSAGRRFIGFFGMSNLVHALGLPLLALCVTGFGLHYLVGNLVTLGVVFACRFSISSRLLWAGAVASPKAAASEDDACLPDDVAYEVELQKLMAASGSVIGTTVAP